MTGAVPGPVLVVGAGLLGTSIGLALSAQGTEVRLRDTQAEHVRTATGLGAGRPDETGVDPRLVVVAVPPAIVGDQVAALLAEFPSAVVTDVGSVKTGPWEHVAASTDPAARARYVGSHPMAGSERSGPLAASAALFEGRPWAVTAHPEAASESVAVVRALVDACGAVAVTMTPAEHDLAVARTSHLPHLLAVLVAGRLVDADPGQLVLSGQGLRDVTRIAASDPGLWRQIVGANAGSIDSVLRELRTDLDRMLEAIGAGDLDTVTGLLQRGVRGTQAIPGKHGEPDAPTYPVYVSVPDHPGELARLFADAGEIGVNVEDVHIDHDPGRPVGLVQLVVADEHAVALVEGLRERGWTARG
ncbi:MAG: prephenate dehydrogenase [Nocardioides sp.]|nr:prephenate dehydrogenase [Nocardioides sp.]